MGFFDGFWSRDFWGLYLKPKGFFGCLFLPPLEYPCHLKSGVPPPPGGDQHEISPCNINALRKQSCHEN